MASLPAVKRGDTWSLTFTYADEDGAPIDLTDCFCQLQLQDKKTKGLLLDVTDDLSISPLTGEVSFSVQIPTTMPIGTHQLDLEMTYADGTIESTDTMTLQIVEDVTRVR